MGSKGSGGGTWGEKKFGLNIFNPNYYVNPDSLRNFEVGPPGHFSIKWISLYVQDHIKIAGKLVLTLGGHLTHASTNFEREDGGRTTHTVFTPRAGLTWLFGDNVSVYALYDQCFLAQGGRSFEHKIFKPLTGFNMEAGVKSYYLNKKLNANLSVFNIERNNSLTGDPVHPGYNISTGQTVSKGVDFDMTGYVTNALVVNANYEYSVARVTKDSDPNIAGGSIFNTPDHRANLWINYRAQSKKLKGMSVAIGNQYSSKRRATNIWEADKTKFLPGYYLLDAALGYSNDRFNLSLNVYNITNLNYAAMGYYSQTGGWRYTPGEPVNFRISFVVNLVREKNR
jgi:iron complex outermembrane receptor protein